MKHLLISFVLGGSLVAGDVSVLPRDHAKETWVRATLARLGLNNDIRVVRDDALGSNNICAYAIIQAGRQYIAYDPGCVTTLTPGEPNYVWSAGVILHEIAHHLGAHTATYGKPTFAEEIEAERWTGWAFRHEGFTLEQAIAYAREGQGEASSTRPGPADRVRAVEAGWRSGGALKAGRQESAPAGANVERLADAARRHLKTLRKDNP